MKKQKINEWGGAGFAMTRSNTGPSYRGGGVNRGGFGGASNIGGPNSMYTYEIKPLNRTLQPDENDSGEAEKIQIGNVIKGREINDTSGKEHKGKLLQIVKDDDDSLMYYEILDQDDAKKYNLDPTDITLISNMYVTDPDDVDYQFDGDEDLPGIQDRANNNGPVRNFNESLLVKESLDFYVSNTINEAKSEFQKLQDNKVPLDKEERAEVMKKKAIWRHGPGGAPSPAVWKSVDKDGKTTYITNTHRAYNTAATLKGAIGKYHNFIKGTA